MTILLGLLFHTMGAQIVQIDDSYGGQNPMIRLKPLSMRLQMRPTLSISQLPKTENNNF